MKKENTKKTAAAVTENKTAATTETKTRIYSPESASLRLLADTRKGGKVQNLPYFTAKEWTNADVNFKAYTAAVENLQRALYKAETGLVPADVKTASVAVYMGVIATMWRLNADEAEALKKHLPKSRTLHAGQKRDVKTAETAAVLKKFAAAKKKAENKPLSLSYTEEDRDAALEKIKAARDAWVNASYRAEAEVYVQKAYITFRKEFEMECGFILCEYAVSRNWETSAQRTNTAAWLRFINRAKENGVDAEPFKAAKDLEGLKAAVKAAHEKKEAEKAAAAVAAAKKENVA